MHIWNACLAACPGMAKYIAGLAVIDFSIAGVIVAVKIDLQPKLYCLTFVLQLFVTLFLSILAVRRILIKVYCVDILPFPNGLRGAIQFYLHYIILWGVFEQWVPTFWSPSFQSSRKSPEWWMTLWSSIRGGSNFSCKNGSKPSSPPLPRSWSNAVAALGVRKWAFLPIPPQSVVIGHLRVRVYSNGSPITQASHWDVVNGGCSLLPTGRKLVFPPMSCKSPIGCAKSSRAIGFLLSFFSPPLLI